LQGSRIVVTGFGAITSLGQGVTALWEGLRAGRRGIGPLRRFDVEGCRCRLAAEAPDPVLPEGRRPLRPLFTTRSARLALVAAHEALSQSGLEAEILRDTALILGSAGAGDAVLGQYLAARGARPVSAWRALAYGKHAMTAAVAESLGVGGPLHTVNTACSSGVVALALGMDLLAAGAVRAVLAGGADELTPYTFSGFSSLRAVDPEPCRPFDLARRGMTLGEGAGVLVLERESDAKARGARVLARLAGVGHCCDSGHLTAPDEDGDGASRALRMALRAAALEPEQIGFINAHGTGTPHNDRAEVAALSRALGSYAPRCPVHSVKSSIGHCMGAAGALEAIITALSLSQGWLPATAGLSEPESPGSVDFVMGTGRDVSARFAASNSFGFGGNDACLVLEAGEAP